MAYKSERQKAWAHSEEGIQALGLQKVQEWDHESKDLKLPERVSKVQPHHQLKPHSKEKPRVAHFAKFATRKKWKSL